MLNNGYILGSTAEFSEVYSVAGGIAQGQSIWMQSIFCGIFLDVTWKREFYYQIHFGNSGWNQGKQLPYRRILRAVNVLACHTDLQGKSLGRYLHKCLPNGFDHMMLFHDHVRGWYSHKHTLENFHLENSNKIEDEYRLGQGSAD